MIKFSAKFVTTGKIRSKICSVFCKEIWCAIQQYDNRIIFKPKEREESGSDQFPPFNSTVDCRLTSSHSRGRGRWFSLVLSSEEERSEVDSRHYLRELCSWECYESHSFVVGAIQCGYIVCLILFSYAEWRLSIGKSSSLKNPFLALAQQHYNGIRESYISRLWEVSWRVTWWWEWFCEFEDMSCLWITFSGRCSVFSVHSNISSSKLCWETWMPSWVIARTIGADESFFSQVY